MPGGRGTVAKRPMRSLMRLCSLDGRAASSRRAEGRISTRYIKPALIPFEPARRESGLHWDRQDGALPLQYQADLPALPEGPGLPAESAQQQLSHGDEQPPVPA